MKIPMFLLGLIACGAESASAQSFSDQIRDSLPLGNELIQQPGRFVERKVTSRFLMNCFTWQGMYHCIPAARKDLIISSPELDGDEAKQLINSTCPNMGLMQRCQIDIVFVIKEFGTDISGSVRTIGTDKMWAKRRGYPG